MASLKPILENLVGQNQDREIEHTQIPYLIVDQLVLGMVWIVVKELWMKRVLQMPSSCS